MEPQIIINPERRSRESGIGWRWSAMTDKGALDVIVPDNVLDWLLRDRWLSSLLADPQFFHRMETAVIRRMWQSRTAVMSPVILLVRDFDAGDRVTGPQGST